MITRRRFITGLLAGLGALYLGRLGVGMTRGSTPDKPVSAPPDPRGGYGKTGGMKIGPRVVSAHSPRATDWDFNTYPYVDSIDGATVLEMLSAGLRELTGERTESTAWGAVFAAYKDGDTVAIKPNFNDLHAGFKGLVASPAVINALLHGLVEILGIPPSSISLYDCTRAMPDELRDRIAYPVNYVEPYGTTLARRVRYKLTGTPLVEPDFKSEIAMTARVEDRNGKVVRCYMPAIVTSADHIINVPILKSHQFVSNSGALKNHYGTVRFGDRHLKPEYLHPPIIHESIVDLNADEEIRGKTRLIVMDALFGRLSKHGGGPERWTTFNGKSPDTLLLSTDPVALDSVALSIIEKEALARGGEPILPHDFLHMAHERGLGVHDHLEGGQGGIKLVEVRA